MALTPTPSARFSWLRVVAFTAVVGTAWLALCLRFRPELRFGVTEYALTFVLGFCVEFLRWDRSRRLAHRGPVEAAAPPPAEVEAPLVQPAATE